MENKTIKCGKLSISNNKPFTLIAGPCQLENEKHALEVSSELKKITDKLGVGLIYKTSFDKANRTSLNGKRGAGLEKSLPIFDKIRKEVGVPLLTDVHTPEQCETVSKHVDVIQIPAFLCRQTDLLVAAAKTAEAPRKPAFGLRFLELATSFFASSWLVIFSVELSCEGIYLI